MGLFLYANCLLYLKHAGFPHHTPFFDRPRSDLAVYHNVQALARAPLF